MLRAAQSGVEGKAARVGKAVQHPLAPGQLGHLPAVVLLVQEEAGLLAVFKVYPVAYAVLADLGPGLLGMLEPLQGEPALVLLQALTLAQRHIVALENALDILSVLAQHIHQNGEENGFQLFHAVGQGLGHQHRTEAVYRQAGKLVGLAEDDPAAAEILRPHHRLAVGPGVFHTAAPEVLVKAVVGVAAEKPYPDLAVLAQKAGAQVAAFGADHVHRPAVGGGGIGLVGELFCVHPGVAGQNSPLSLGSDGIDGIGAALFHKTSSSLVKNEFVIFIIAWIGPVC